MEDISTKIQKHLKSTGRNLGINYVLPDKTISFLLFSGTIKDASGEVVFKLQRASMSTTLKTAMVTPDGQEVGGCQRAGFFNTSTGYITEGTDNLDMIIMVGFHVVNVQVPR